MQKNKPVIISIEGGEGAGKSSVIEMISDYFKEKCIDVMITREPGGVRISERIRRIILDQTYNEMDPRTEALLFAAARRQHLVEKVIPAFKAGKTVVFDRFVDSSLVYQGFVRGLGIEEVYELNQFATEGFIPHLTVYLDVTPQVGLERIHCSENREINKLDLESLEFHEKVRQGYLILVEKYPTRIVKIDANQSLDKVLTAVIKQIELLV